MLLAVTSIARLRFPFRDPRMSGFVDGIERVNRLADATPGFVWRHRGAAGHSATGEVLGFPNVLVNVSLWTDYPSLHAFTYRGLHGRYLTARERWFLPIPGATTVLWWVSADERPDADAGVARLRLLRARGPSPRAFTVLRRWAADGMRDASAPGRHPHIGA